MRTYYDIHLGTHTIERHALHGKEIVLAGRYLIAKTPSSGLAAVDPRWRRRTRSSSRPVLQGTSFSNANRTSAGCKSPLTGGIKEANGGGTFSYGLGRRGCRLFTSLRPPEWVIIHFKKDGTIAFDSAAIPGR